MSEEKADEGWDSYAERVLRNEGKLEGLQSLVAETREADRKLVEQRADSLAQELERTTATLVTLARAEREADLGELRAAVTQSTDMIALLREMYDDKIQTNYEQSRDSIAKLEEKVRALVGELDQKVTAWRESDREARQLFSKELDHHLERLNHAHDQQVDFQARSVTRELFLADKTAQESKDNVVREQIVALEKALLGMQPTSLADKAHAEIITRMEATIAAAVKTLDTKIDTVNEKMGDLKSSRDSNLGGRAAVAMMFSSGIAIITVVVIVANLFTSR